MPGSGLVPSSQGSTASFGGSALGDLIAIRVTGATAAGTDVTTMDSAVSGSGADSRIAKELDVLAVEPGSVSVTFFGAGPSADVGDKAELSVSIGGSVVISGEAFLASYDVEASVGELVRGSATFQLTGA